MHRFFVSPETITNQKFSSHDEELIHQLSRVLKIRAGEKILVLDNAEHEYLIELSTVNKKAIEGKVLKKENKLDISSSRQIHLFVPPLKNTSRWEWMLEKCTEIGVTSFTPLITARTEVKELRKIERLERIIKEAAEQSGRTKLPVIHEPLTFQNAVKNDGTNLIATLTPGAEPITGTDAPRRVSTKYNLFIGPVGDFTPEEITLALEHKFYPISLGSQILRTETAAMVGVSLLTQAGK